MLAERKPRVGGAAKGPRDTAAWGLWLRSPPGKHGSLVTSADPEILAGVDGVACGVALKGGRIVPLDLVRGGAQPGGDQEERVPRLDAVVEALACGRCSRCCWVTGSPSALTHMQRRTPLA
jgi:hypothetical protein